MSAGGVKEKMEHNDRSMANGLPSTASLKGHDSCCGIHGLMRRRQGIKHGTVCARRRHDKEVIQEGLKDTNEHILPHL